ncbi:hypothetical protein M440DRAFT_1137857 [Trichoderma longibrachiatum ATCC 18648]|uniref:Secreted protein n=1 Tax=Trichoderma longibrachiatum ATCC 18648 TaxID=983965 RepID=A0A2T4BRA7_TRILO|nr:hypothetical protein M440DRAFT_1137857 [Trichoderma longibrachiatum ATCC 18648]
MILAGLLIGVCLAGEAVTRLPIQLGPRASPLCPIHAHTHSSLTQCFPTRALPLGPWVSSLAFSFRSETLIGPPELIEHTPIHPLPPGSVPVPLKHNP